MPGSFPVLAVGREVRAAAQLRGQLVTLLDPPHPGRSAIPEPALGAPPMPPDDESRPNSKVNMDLRRAAGKGQFSSTPQQSPTSRSMNAAIHAAARRGWIIDRGVPVTEPAPAADVQGGGPGGSVSPQPPSVSARMNAWLRRSR